MKSINNQQKLSKLGKRLLLQWRKFLKRVPLISRRAYQLVKLLNFHILNLIVAHFFAAYFSTASKYNINLLFDHKKWSKFDLMYKCVEIGDKSYNMDWKTKFFLAMLLFYVLGIAAKILIGFAKQKAKAKVANDLNNNYDIEPDQWMLRYANTIVEFVSLLSSVVFALVLEIWSAVRVNLTREIKASMFLRFVCCLLLMVLVNMGLRILAKQLDKRVKTQASYNELLPHTAKAIKDSYFYDMGNLFLIMLFLLFPQNSDLGVKDLILAVLFSYNIAALISKSRAFFAILPELAANYRLWVKTQELVQK